MPMLKKGFTFIEMVMLLLIVGILSAVIIIDIANTTSLSKLQAARFKLKSDIIYAQSLAVTQQVNHGVIFNPVLDTYSVYWLTTGNIVKNPLTQNDFTVNFSTDKDFQGINLVSISFGSLTSDRVEFNNLGVPSDGTTPLSSNGSIVIGYQGSSSTITVTKNTGKVD